MRNRCKSFLVIAHCLFLFVVLSQNQTQAAGNNATVESVSPSTEATVVSAPFFLRSCVKELIKQWGKKSGKTLFLYEKSREGRKEEPKSLIDFFITPVKRRFPKNSEVSQEKKKRVLKLGVLALAIYTHKANPLKGLTVAQIDGIFSEQRRCGLPFQVKTFGQLGLTGHWIDLEVIPFGISSAPDTLKWFQTSCLCNGHLNKDVKLLDTKADLFQAVSTQPGAVGFYLYTQKEKQVRPVAVCRIEGEDYFLPTVSNIKAGIYPLSANLYVRFKKENLDKNGLSFLKFCLSKGGQKILSSYDILPAYAAGYNGKELHISNTGSKKN